MLVLSRFAAPTTAALFATALLIACGGGGGGDSPAVTPPVSGGTSTVVVTPTNYTATTLCASGPALTSTVSQAAANALVPSACPALPASAYAATSVVVGSGTLTISVSGLPSGFTSGVLTATKFTPDISVVWDLIPTTTGNASATLRSGSSALGFATGYAGSVEMNFVGAPSARKTLTFTTSAAPVVTCTAPAMLTSANTCISPPTATGYTWNNTMKAWIADIGVLVTGANTLPAACVTIGDACWLASVANGTVKFVNSGAKTTGWTINETRPIVFAFYVTKISGVDYYNIKSMFSDAEAETPSGNPNTGNGASGNVRAEIKGTHNGALYTVPTQGCFEWVWQGGGFGSNSTSTCPI